MAADRGAYIDQSQSLNIHMVGALFTGVWGLGFQAGMYSCTSLCKKGFLGFSKGASLVLDMGLSRGLIEKSTKLGFDDDAYIAIPNSSTHSIAFKIRSPQLDGVFETPKGLDTICTQCLKFGGICVSPKTLP